MFTKDWRFSEKITGFSYVDNNSSNAINPSFRPIIIPTEVQWERTDVFPFCTYPRLEENERSNISK